jgi:hypothetical protein
VHGLSQKNNKKKQNSAIGNKIWVKAHFVFSIAHNTRVLAHNTQDLAHEFWTPTKNILACSQIARAQAHEQGARTHFLAVLPKLLGLKPERFVLQPTQQQ